MAGNGVKGTTAVFPRAEAGDCLRRMSAFESGTPSSFSPPERPVNVEQYVKDELLGKLPELKENLLQAFRKQGKKGTDDQIVNELISSLHNRIRFIEPLYSGDFPDLATVKMLNHHKLYLEKQRFPVPDPSDWIKIQNLLTKDIVGQLVSDAADRGSVLPFKAMDDPVASHNSRNVMTNALTRIGLLNRGSSTNATGKPIDRVGVDYCQKALDYWVEGVERYLDPPRS